MHCSKKNDWNEWQANDAQPCKWRCSVNCEPLPFVAPSHKKETLALFVLVVYWKAYEKIRRFLQPCVDIVSEKKRMILKITCCSCENDSNII